LLGVPGDVDPLATQPPKPLTEPIAAVTERPSMIGQPPSAQGGEDEDLVVVSGI
jgi:hypothetical protein